MEHLWIKPSHEQEAEQLSTLSDKALENLNTSTQTKEILDEETQNYFEQRFPKTNEDNLQEDAAKKFIIDGEYLERLHQLKNEGDQANQEIADSLWDIYEKMMEAEAYLDVYKDINPRVNKLLDNLRILELHTEISDHYPLAKSGISNREAYQLVQDEISHIKSELNEIRSHEATKESVAELVEKYKALTEKYNTVRTLIEPDNSSLN